MTRFHRLRTRIAGLVALLLVATVLSVVQAGPAQAVTGSDFNPGNIISDAKFFDGNAMSASAVQQFLSSQVTSCSAGYTCLKDYRESTWTRGADQMCGVYAGVANETSAQIIAKVGQACGVSQKVLLVLLQKEQSLVTDSNPSSGQFRSATGFACPDTAPCDSQYYGFYNQVYKAAWQYKRYTNPPGTSQFFTWFPVGGVSNILYNPNSACGSSPVRIQNSATAALYYYTPYQPNAVALSNLYGGQSDGCSSYGNRNFWRLYWDWFGSPTDVDNSPLGNIDSVSSTLTTATLTGWTFDPETSASIDVHAYIGGQVGVGGWGGAFTANVVRPDIEQRWPGYGSKHGFVITIPAPATATPVCLYAYNVGQGANVLLGCPTVAKPTGPPFGNLESVTLSGRTATLTGWVIDPDLATPIDVHAYVNGTWAGLIKADRSRPDVGRAFPGYGDAHGFSISVPVPVGTSTVCIYGINNGLDGNPQFGCGDVSTASGPPQGNVESLSVAGRIASFSGWALDPDTPDPIDVHAYVNGNWAGLVKADRSRPDVGRIFPGYGDGHGFAGSVTLSAGSNQVCLYGYNVKRGQNTTLSCQTVTTPTGGPMGNLEAATAGNGTISVSGWALDPDSLSSIDVHIYVNGAWGGLVNANAYRGDIDRVFPGFGPQHGFGLTVPAKKGPNTVCAFGIDTSGAGPNSQLGSCIVVP